MRAYTVVDAFSAEPFKGNPVAVILDAQGLDTAQMQAIANWTNLSETTFVLPATQAGADYTLRIFTPLSELPFAGHPTLGSAHALLSAGRVQPRDGVLVQECAKGLVRIAIEGEGPERLVHLELPEPRITPLAPAEIDALESVLGGEVDRAHPPAIVDVGAVWVVARVAHAETVLALTPDFARMATFERRVGATGVTVFGAHAPDATAEIEVRSFAPSCGIAEDPVCGSGNGSVAAFRQHYDLLPESLRYLATQGGCVGRDGRILLGVTPAGTIQVGGQCVTCAEGTLHA
ncbi:PhzF family phenazine biosynthesis protein [Novosphingobium profundi]|uniref:PhzF family phenazine biosynthesis protein n=1 Tax=Novosphingobium profundi TaxID=1774954 RepID=UPI001BD9CAE5|nr:PhzF family phenazine biosynthesis protein [Novosphingobium profundi]MBT0669228.1 PhzF family phenazine biosynthesis protein [Novosphingobium profundi]